MDNFSTEFSLECVKREIKTLSRDELEEKTLSLFGLAHEQSAHIATLNLAIKNLQEKCVRLSRALAKFNGY